MSSQAQGPHEGGAVAAEDESGGAMDGLVKALEHRAWLLAAENKALGHATQQARGVAAQQAHRVASLERCVERCEQLVCGLAANVHLVATAQTARVLLPNVHHLASCVCAS